MENFSADLTTLVRSASGLAKLVLFILLGLSILSWGIILEKWLLFRRARWARKGIQNFNITRLDPETLRKKLEAYPHSPITKAYRKIYLEYFSTHLQEGNEDLLTHTLQKRGADEVAQMEIRLGILATVGSVSPFIGLFGTVWGVMRAFLNIGTWGSTSLAVVAPGIAEALIATAAGLAAAIPAVIFYNYFLGLLREESRALEQFAAEVSLAERLRQKVRLAVSGTRG